jgi:hypothetical protein
MHVTWNSFSVVFVKSVPVVLLVVENKKNSATPLIFGGVGFCPLAFYEYVYAVSSVVIASQARS